MSEEQKQYLEYVRTYLQSKRRDSNFVIDGDGDSINGIPLSEITNLPFSNEGDLKDELVCVHATDFFPSNNEIISGEKGNAKVTRLGYGSGITHHRITVHTTLNTLVANNNGGNWAVRKYIILQPFKEIESKVCGFGVSDTFFEDQINLTADSIVLMDEKNKDSLTEEEKQMNIVFYKGNPRNAVSQAMIMMGYKSQSININSFGNEENTKLVQEYRTSEGYGPSLHSFTKYSHAEGAVGSRDGILSDLRGERVDSNNIDEITPEELQELFSKGKNNYISGNEQIIDFLLSKGISIDEDYHIHLLNTHELIDRVSKYYDDENDKFKEETYSDPENISEVTRFMLSRRICDVENSGELIKEIVSKDSETFYDNGFACPVNKFFISVVNDDDSRDDVFDESFVSGTDYRYFDGVDQVSMKFDPNDSVINAALKGRKFQQYITSELKSKGIIQDEAVLEDGSFKR